MCIDDKKKRLHLVIKVTQALTTTQLNFPTSINLEFFELTGYQFVGVPVAAGVPYSPFFVVSLGSSSFFSENLITNIPAVQASLGVVLPLGGSFTTQQYDTPRKMTSKNALVKFGGASPVIEVRISDELGQAAQFTEGYLYCYAVYSETDCPVPASVTSRFADISNYGPHRDF